MSALKELFAALAFGTAAIIALVREEVAEWSQNNHRGGSA